MKKSLIQITFYFLIIFAASGSAFSANEYFRSITSGDWNSTATWQMSTNSGSTWIAATLTPTDASGFITVRYPNTVTVTADVNADQLSVDSGSISINTGIVFTLLNGTGNDLTVLKGGTVTGAGIFQTQGAVLMNLRSGSNFRAALKINTGSTTVSDLNTPFDGKLFGNVTIDAGATLNTNNSVSYSLFVYGNITNNGTITGTSSTLKFYGSTLSNNGIISSPNLSLDSTSSLSGSGTYTGGNIIVTGNGNISLLNNVTFSVSGKLTIYNGGIFSANSFILTFTSGTIEILSGGTVANSGTVRTQGTVAINPRTGSAFRANLNVASGTTSVAELSTPFNGRLYGNVTVDNGAVLNSLNSSSYTLLIYGNLTNNGTVTGVNSTVKFYGATLTNSGSIASPSFSFDSTTTLSSSGTFTGANIIIGSTGNVSLLSNVTFSPGNEILINTGGKFSANTYILTVTTGEFRILSGGTVLNSGTVRTQGSVFLNPRTGSSFNANLNVASGTTTASELNNPYNAKLYGNVTVDNGATLSSNNTSSYTLFIYGNLTNNGTITGVNSSVKFYGPALINNGSITSPNFSFDSTTSLSGSGTFTGANITLSGNVTLLNSITFSPASGFSINTGGIFSAGGNIFTYNSGTFTVFTGGTVVNSGTVRTQGNVTINPRTGSSFNANLNVASGTTICSELLTPFNGRLYGNITIDNGATLSTNVTSSYTLFIFGNITNNGTITGVGEIDIQSGSHSLQGTGSIIPAINLLSGAIVTLNSNHQMSSVDINTGASFDISNRVLGLTASVPIIQNGTFTTTNSDIIYNGSVFQTIPTANISYAGLKINNPSGTLLSNNMSIPDTLAVILGDIDLNGKIITITSTGYLTETKGNTVKGNTGYITTTRNAGTPTALNIGGLGAILTATTNLGNTEVRRGHTVQTGLNGGTSIRRYYDITPANNTGLNANLIFSYDDSELNGKPEPSLKLFKSTNSGSTWLYQTGTVNIATNQITLNGISSFSRWSADSSKVSAAISVIQQGFYNISTNNLNLTDTVRAYLRNVSFPYAIADSSIGLLDSLTFKSGLQFDNALTGTYYIQIKHRNCIETWSKFGVYYIQDSTLNYDFTFALSQAFGNNMVKKGLKYCLFSGDVNQDGAVDAGDLSEVENAASISLSGYEPTDVTGDDIVDADDVSLVENNATLGVFAVTP